MGYGPPPQPGRDQGAFGAGGGGALEADSVGGRSGFLQAFMASLYERTRSADMRRIMQA